MSDTYTPTAASNSGADPVDVHDVLALLDGVTKRAGEPASWMARCPAHDDSNPSLSVSQRPGGAVSLHCFAGCPTASVRAALNLPEVSEWMPVGITHVATYSYCDRDGAELFQVLRGRKDGQKTFRQRTADPENRSGWKWSVAGLSTKARATLYMAPAVAAAIDAGETIYVVEGEKDVHTALAHGLTATCNAGGAGKFTARHAEQLRDADVVVVQDTDDPGRAHGAQVCRLLTGVAASVRLVEAATGKDLTDHFDAGLTVDDLMECVAASALASSSSGSGGGPVAPTGAPSAPVPDGLGVGEWSDSSVSERLATIMATSWCWTAATGWLEWGSLVWERRSDEAATEAARRFAKAEVARVLNEGGDLAEAIKLLNRARITSIITLARGQLERDFADFDADPDLLVAGNGVIDLRTGALLPHDPSRSVTKCTLVHYLPGVTHADWDEALTAVEPENAAYLKARFGQAITGYPPEDDVLLVLRGGGENGKTTLESAVLNATGDYAATLPPELLLGNPDDHPTKFMTLKGLRIGVIEEAPEDKYLDLRSLKAILGTPTITGRYMRRDHVVFDATHAVFLSTNYALGVTETDTGSWRRLAEMPFPFRYRKPSEPLEDPNDRRGNPRLRDAVRLGKAQQEAVLAWLVDGARRWYDNGRALPEPPESVKAATWAWRRRSDAWLEFAEDYLVVEDGYAVWIEDLHYAMSVWQRGRSQRPWAAPLFRARLEANVWLQQPGIYLSGRTRLGVNVTMSRPTIDFAPKGAPAQGQFLMGVRFRTVADDVAASPTPDPNSPTPAAPSSIVVPFRPAAGVAPGETIEYTDRGQRRSVPRVTGSMTGVTIAELGGVA